MDESRDADRWLFLHEREVIGADSAAAVEAISRAGLTATVARYRGLGTEPGAEPSGRIRLYVGDDGHVRTAETG